MYNPQKSCRNFSLKIHIRATERFFARAGIFKYGFSAYNNYFKLETSNIYKEPSEHKLRRMKLKWQHGFISTLLDNCDFISEVRDEDINIIPFMFDCWKSHSEFVVYFYMTVPPHFYIEKITESNPGGDGEPFYPDDRYTFRCSPENCCYLGQYNPCLYHYLILPWFDRVDRMIFWKCLTRVCLANKFQSKHMFVRIIIASLQRLLELAVFIQDYL
jgi:hypothetical protein